MNQLNEMEAYITPMWNERFSEDQKKIYDYFQEHQTEIAFNFCNYIVQGMVSDVCRLQASGKQNEIACLVIHFLRSSLLNRSYDYEINLCNKTLYLDENSTAGYWYPEFLYQFTGNQELFLKKELQIKFVKIKAHEIELLRWTLFLQYGDIAKPYFKVLTDCLLQRPEFKQVKTNGELQVLYGEHMGKLEELKSGGDV